MEDIADNIERGIDVFDASWASATAARGRAFSFPIDASDAYELEDASSRAMTAPTPTLSTPGRRAYKTDFVPFLDAIDATVPRASITRARTRTISYKRTR